MRKIVSCWWRHRLVIARWTLWCNKGSNLDIKQSAPTRAWTYYLEKVNHITKWMTIYRRQNHLVMLRHCSSFNALLSVSSAPLAITEQCKTEVHSNISNQFRFPQFSSVSNVSLVCFICFFKILTSVHQTVICAVPRPRSCNVWTMLVAMNACVPLATPRTIGTSVWVSGSGCPL